MGGEEEKEGGFGEEREFSTSDFVVALFKNWIVNSNFTIQLRRDLWGIGFGFGLFENWRREIGGCVLILEDGVGVLV